MNHNLNIHMYKLDELLGLFDLTERITPNDLKQAKKKVLMLHPDKSKLDSEYFLFYKKALDIIVEFYETQNKMNTPDESTNTDYSPTTKDHSWNKSTDKKIHQIVNDMSKKDFHSQFNELFDKNMRKEPTPDINQWFRENDPLYQIEENAGKNMSATLEKVKKQTSSLAIYKGVQTLHSGSGSRLYEPDADEISQEYVSCDPFSKLKFDDLRKVHKDQTVFAVSESDFDKMPKYASVDQYNRARTEANAKPMEKNEAEKMMSFQEQERQKIIMKREYEAKLESMKYAEKNKSVLSTFLRIT